MVSRWCKYCGKPLGPGRRQGAEYCDSTCRARSSEQALRSAQRKPQHPLAPIRATQEAAKARWSAIVREGIIQALLANRDGFHADDLERLGIPAEHRNVIGAQIGRLVTQGWIEECGRRRSRIPSRHGAKSGVYRVTGLGWQNLKSAGSGAGEIAREANTGSGPPGDGTPRSNGQVAALASKNAAASVAPDARLFPLPVRNAIRGPEAA